MTDPQIVLQAHALRARVSRAALLHGGRPPRTRRTPLAVLAGSAALAVTIVVAILVVGRIVAVLHQSGH